MGTIVTDETYLIPIYPKGTYRALLINPPVYDAQYWARWSQPAGLLRIATLLKEKGYQIEAAQVPLLGSNASPNTLGSVKYIWRTSYVNDEAGRALGGYLATRRNQSVYVVSDDSEPAREQVSGFLRTFNGLPGHPDVVGDPVQIPLVSSPNLPLGSYLNAIHASGARTVFAAFSADTAIPLAKYSAGDADVIRRYALPKSNVFPVVPEVSM